MSFSGKAAAKSFHANISTEAEAQEGQAWLAVSFIGCRDCDKITAFEDANLIFL